MADAMSDITKDKLEHMDMGLFPDTIIMPGGRDYWRLWRSNGLLDVAKMHFQWLWQRNKNLLQ